MTYPNLTPQIVGRTGYPVSFYEAIAARYIELAGTHGKRIAPVIAEETGANVATVHHWIIRARELGVLPSAKDITYAPMRLCLCGQGQILHDGKSSVGGRPVRGDTHQGQE